MRRNPSPPFDGKLGSGRKRDGPGPSGTAPAPGHDSESASIGIVGGKWLLDQHDTSDHLPDDPNLSLRRLANTGAKS